MIPFSCSLYGTLHPEAPGAVVLKPGASTASLSCQLCLFSLTLLRAFADKYWIITSYSPISFSSVGNKLEWVTLITWLHFFLCYSIILLVSVCMGWGDACLYTHEHRPHMWKIEHILKFHIETVSLVCCYMHQAPWQEFPGILLSLPSISIVGVHWDYGHMLPCVLLYVHSGHMSNSVPRLKFSSSPVYRKHLYPLGYLPSPLLFRFQLLILQ